MNSKKILTVGLIIVLSMSTLEAKSRKKEKAREGGCITARVAKYATEAGVLSTCAIFGPLGVGVCTAGLIIADNTLDKKLEKVLCD